MSAIEEKQRLRIIFKDKRNALTDQEVAAKSHAINQNFISNLLPQIYQGEKSKIFSIYHSSYNEVATVLIEEHFIKNNIKFSYPIITKKDHHLDFIAHQQNQSFTTNFFFPKILEPLSGNKVAPNIIIMPLLAFDPYLSRLGMGGGFFDRTIEFLKKENYQIITIALAYDFQRHEGMLETENTDQRLDFVVTEKMIYSAS